MKGLKSLYAYGYILIADKLIILARDNEHMSILSVHIPQTLYSANVYISPDFTGHHDIKTQHVVNLALVIRYCGTDLLIAINHANRYLLIDTTETDIIDVLTRDNSLISINAILFGTMTTEEKSRLSAVVAKIMNQIGVTMNKTKNIIQLLTGA